MSCIVQKFTIVWDVIFWVSTWVSEKWTFVVMAKANLLAVRNWEFQQTAAPGIGGEVNPLKLLRRRSSLVVNDLPFMQLQTSLSSVKKATAAPTTFEEPDAGSLLDSFGL